jgi:hypothetical protein
MRVPKKKPALPPLSVAAIAFGLNPTPQKRITDEMWELIVAQMGVARNVSGSGEWVFVAKGVEP